MNNTASMVTTVISFEKESGVWYAKTPLNPSENQGENKVIMLNDAHQLLDYLSKNGIGIDILFSGVSYGGFDAVIKKVSLASNEDVDGFYETFKLDNSPLYYRFSLNPAFQLAFGGHFPEELFIKVLNIKSDGVVKVRKTIYHLIVDKSGSMGDCIESTVNGINEQINMTRQKEEEYPEEDITIGLTTFNHSVTEVFRMKKPKDIQLLSTQNYRTDGSTALLDAIGFTVRNLESIHAHSELTIPTTVVVVIITDGEENASRTFMKPKIKRMIERLQSTDKWKFCFIGSGIDAISDARSMGINEKNSYNFEKNVMQEEVFKKLSFSMDGHFYDSRHNIKRDRFIKD